MFHNLLFKLAFFLLVLLSTAACGLVQVGIESTPVVGEPGSPGGGVNEPLPSETSAPAPTQAPPSGPETACPTPGAQASLYVNAEYGFCFLVPLGHQIEADTQNPGASVIVRGPTETPDPKQQELASVWMRVSYNGPARGLDAEGYAKKWFELSAGERAPDQQTFSPIAVELAGAPAVMLDEVPGMITQQATFVVSGGHKYLILLAPAPGSVPELDAAVSALWKTVSESIGFFEPQQQTWKTPEEVCPQPGEGETLYVEERSGFCFLYPSDFEQAPNLPPGFITGGPVVTTHPDFGDVRVGLAVGEYGAYAQGSLRGLVQAMADVIDMNSVSEATIAGYPALVHRTTQPPWAHRVALVEVGSRVYSITAQPWEPELYPLSVEPLERLWVTVTSSIAFFEPFR